MLHISENERETILRSHLEYKRQLFEQAAVNTPGALNLTPTQLAQKIVKENLCFCKPNVANCLGVYNENDGSVFIRAQMLTDSNLKLLNGQPFNSKGDFLRFYLNDYKQVNEKNTNLKYNWQCQSLIPQINQLRSETIKKYVDLGWKTYNQLTNADVEDIGRYEKLDLAAKYPFLFPPWGVDTSANQNRYLYNAKNKTLQGKSNSFGTTEYEIARINAAKKVNKDLKTMSEILTDRGVNDFTMIAGEYTPYRIGEQGDGVFDRDFFLYFPNKGQTSGKENVGTIKTAMKELNISKDTCVKLINKYYEAYRVKNENMPAPQFEQIKNQVTYCARKYDDFGILGVGGNKVKEKIDTLKTLSSTNKFKINV